MVNEIRYYLKAIRALMNSEDNEEPFKPQYLVTATKLPTGSIELIVNTDKIAEKIDYILEAYDDDMHLKTNSAVSILNMLVV